MEKINTEILISSLLAVGFEKVDSILFTYILSKLSIDNRTMQSFEFIDEEFSNTFKEYVSYDGNTYMIKDMYTIDTLIMTKNGNVPLRKLLHTNKKLITYLDLLDFREIIMKKISLLGAKQLDTIPNYFSNKEKEIMYKMFGIEAMHHEKAIERAIAYENIYEEEAHSMDTLDIDGFLKDIIIRDEEVTKISSRLDYINWLKIFTKKYPGFCFDDWTHDRKELTDEDIYNVRKLNIFYDAIEEYATKKNIDGTLDGEGYYYLIKHENSFFKVGFISGQGTIFYLDSVEANEKAIDFNDIIKENAKRKTRVRKKKN